MMLTRCCCSQELLMLLNYMKAERLEKFRAVSAPHYPTEKDQRLEIYRDIYIWQTKLIVYGHSSRCYVGTIEACHFRSRHWYLRFVSHGLTFFWLI
jgi:hypothetical protein